MVDYFSIIDNTINGSIHISPTWHADASSNIHIEGNNISLYVTLFKVDGVYLKDNHINNKVVIDYAYNVKVIGNKIQLSPGNSAIALRLSILNSIGNRGLIENNFLYTASGSLIYYSPLDDAPDYTDIFNNSLYLDNSVGGNLITVFSPVNATNLRVYNNIVKTEGSGIFFYLTHDISNIEFNNNNYYRPSSASGNFARLWNVNGQGINQYLPSITDWQVLSGNDLNSFQIDPGFVSGNSDLHIGTVYQLDGSGNSITNLSVDIDGDIRNPNIPDIGADEIELPPIGYDIGIVAFDSIITSCDSVPIFVRIRNYGDSIITNFVIDWSISQLSQDSVVWNGTLEADSITDPILIGYHDFNPANMDSLLAWTYLPNGQVDTVVINDSLETLPLGGKFSGTYSIGSTASDFLTFTEAFDLLKLYGVCGPVTLEVKDGIYPERLQIGNILGSSSVNTITITSQNQNKDLVLLGDTNSFPGFNDYTINLINGCHYLYFDKISLANYGWSSDYIVELDSGINDIYFNECKFVGDNYSSTPGAIHAITDGPLDTIIFTKCDFIRVSKAFYIDVNYNTTNILIDGCNFLTPNSGINIVDANDITIQNSYFEAPASGFITLDIRSAWNINLIGNHFEDMKVYFNGTDGEANNMGLIANNFFNSSTHNALEFGHSDYYRIYNNNFYGTGNFTGLSVYYNSNIDIVNNNIYSDGITSYSLINSSFSYALRSYNNNIFPENIRFNGTILNSISNFSLASSGLDSNSIGIDPIYISPKDLHILNPALEGTAMILPEISIDIDQEIRNVTSPDMGADEVDFLGLDALVYSLESPSTICEGNNQVYVRIKNQGIDTLTTVDIYLQINDSIFPPFLWSGILPTGQISVNINLGVINFPFDSNYIFKIWTDNPNGSLDELISNDSLILSQPYFPALTGSYTVGGVSPNYATLNDAANALLNNGICGPVEFNIRDGIYNEQITLTDVTGSSSFNTITFQSESLDSSLVTLQFNSGSANNHIVKISADYVVFRHLSFKALNSLYGRLFYYEGADYLTIEHSLLTGVNAAITQPFGDRILVFNQWGKDDGLILRNNTFINGSYAFHGGGDTGSSGNAIGYVISDNHFIDQQYGVLFPEFISNFIISSNTIESSILDYDNMQAIKFYISSSNGIIEKNKINDYNGIGINASELNSSIIRNNFVSVKKQNSSVYVSEAINAGQFNTILNNTFIVHQGSANYSFVIGIGDYGNEIKNNIFINLDGGFALRFNYPISSNILDYNCYYSNGVNLVNDNSNLYNTITQWQTASSQDGNSVASNPFFISSSDLHIINAPLLDNSGVSHPNVIGDLRASSPDIGADEFLPLAEEVEAISINPLIITCDSSGIEMTIKNNGINLLTSTIINWTVNGVAQSSYTWTGNLAFQATSSPFIFGGYNFQMNNQYQIVAWVENPNGLADPYQLNDTTTSNVNLNAALYLGPDDTICSSVPVLLDAGNLFSTYLWSTGSTNSSISVSVSGTYWVTASNSYGCLSADTIQIDTFPASIPPTISVNGANMLSNIANDIQWYYQGFPISGATFQIYTATQSGWYAVELTDSNDCAAMSDTVNIYVVGLIDNNIKGGEVKIYPNPTTGKFQVSFFNFSKKTHMEVRNTIGQVVFNKDYLQKGEVNDEIDLTNLNTGVYSVILQSVEKQVVKQVVINR